MKAMRPTFTDFNAPERTLSTRNLRGKPESCAASARVKVRRSTMGTVFAISSRRFCCRPRLHFDHRDYSANGWPAAGAGHKSYRPTGLLLLPVALQFGRGEPGLFAVLAVVIDHVQLAPADCAFNAPGGDAQQFSRFALRLQFHEGKITHLRHMRQNIS